MNFIKISLLLVSVFIVSLSFAQDLSKHQWENRLILLITDDESNSTFQSQLAELRKDLTGLNERKLILYQVMPEAYRTGLDDGDIKESAHLYQGYKKTDSRFEVVLVGLDGGIKLRKNEILLLEELYAIIDAMPMRLREMERKKQR